MKWIRYSDTYFLSDMIFLCDMNQKNVFIILMVSKIWKVMKIGAWKPTSFIFYLLMCDNIWILCYILCLIITTMKSDWSIANISSKSNISSERNGIAFFNVNINLCNCDSRACYIFQLFVLFVLFEIQLINLIHCYNQMQKGLLSINIYGIYCIYQWNT